MKYITEKELQERIMRSLRERNLVIELSERQEYVAKIKKLNLRGKKTALLGGDCYAINS